MTLETARHVRSYGAAQDEIASALARAASERWISKLWTKDPTLWKSEDQHRKNIEGSLGWLTVPAFVRERLQDIEQFAEAQRDKFSAVVVLGMGGSSLCPEVLRRSIGTRKGYPDLWVLDSTVPAAVQQLDGRIDVERTLFIAASKSGSTTEPQMFYRYFRGRVEGKKGQAAGGNFIAITDPGTQLESEATRDGFLRVFLNPSDIGGRYSALSLFGMVPAALAGMDVNAMLMSAADASGQSAEHNPDKNYAARLGVILGTLARNGRDKLTIVASPPLDSVGLWIEQLIAESTGKEGRGILPVGGEALGPAADYGDDRVFVWVHTAGFEDAAVEARLKELAEAGHPVIEHGLSNVSELGGEFFTWEVATAICGATLGINPFDQPNVQESKDNTKRLLEQYAGSGSLPEQQVVVDANDLRIYAADATLQGDDPVEVLRHHLGSVKAGDYFAITQYIAESPEHEILIDEIRLAIKRTLKVATTTGYGPRFLHSTGQLHKGGGANGVFMQITADDERDVPIPGQPFGFSILKQAQALGDFESLANRNRRAIRVHLPAQVEHGLNRLRDALHEALKALGSGTDRSK